MPPYNRTLTCHHLDHMRDTDGCVVTRNKAETDLIEEYMHRFCTAVTLAEGRRDIKVALAQKARNEARNGAKNRCMSSTSC